MRPSASSRSAPSAACRLTSRRSLPPPPPRPTTGDAGRGSWKEPLPPRGRRQHWQKEDRLDDVAAAIARAVTGAEAIDGGNRLLADVAAALEALDDAQLVVAVNSRDLQLLMGGLAGRPGVSVIEDAALRPGEARVRGPWAVAELTRDALWSSVGEALRLGERASPAPAAPRAGADEPVSEDAVN